VDVVLIDLGRLANVDGAVLDVAGLLRSRSAAEAVSP
jgi:hypothetical protein